MSFVILYSLRLLRRKLSVPTDIRNILPKVLSKDVLMCSSWRLLAYMSPEESAPVILVFTNEYAVPMKNVDLSAKLVVIVELT